jgi:hypothetical protein
MSSLHTCGVEAAEIVPLDGLALATKANTISIPLDL